MSQLIINENDNLYYLARDIAVLTANQLYSVEEICQAYKISAEQYAQLQQEAAFQERVAQHKNKIGNDRASLIRAQAKLMSESHLRTLQEIASDPTSKPGDKLKAIQTLNELADVKPKNSDGVSGLVLNVSFGSGFPALTVAADGATENE